MMFKFLVLFALCSNVLVWASPISSEAGVSQRQHSKKLYECNAEGNLVEKVVEDMKDGNEEQDVINDEKLEQNDEDDEENENGVDIDEATEKKVNKIKRLLKEFQQRVKNAVHDLVENKHEKLVEIVDSLKEKARKFWKKVTGNKEADTITQELMSFH